VVNHLETFKLRATGRVSRAKSRDNYMISVYMIKNNKDELYIGISQNTKLRLEEHNKQRGSKCTKSGNFQIVFQENHPSLTKARQREIQIKKWRREKKELLIERYKQRLPTI